MIVHRIGSDHFHCRYCTICGRQLFSVDAYLPKSGMSFRLRNNGSPVYNERKQRWSVSQNCHLICLTLRHLFYSLPTRLLAYVQYQQRIAGLKHMEIVTPDHPLTEQQKTAVWSILCLCQDEFVPPLSRRRSTTQQFISESVTSDHFQPTAYYQELLQQSFLLVQLDRQIIGFLSYKDQHTIQVPSEWNPAASLRQSVFIRIIADAVP